MKAPIPKPTPQPHPGQYTVTREDLARLRSLCGHMFEAHWAEVAAHESVPLDLAWDAYAERERAHCLPIWVMWYDEEPVGYAAFHLFYPVHYQGTLHADSDVIYLAPAHRGHRLGSLMVSRVHDELKALGVAVVRWHVKTYLDWSSLLTAAGCDFTNKIVERLL